MPVSMVKKYLVQKLGLVEESEVQIYTKLYVQFPYVPG